MRPAVPAVLFAMFGLFACATVDDAELSVQASHGNPCFGCGDNGGEVDEVDFYGMWRDGMPNERGVRLVGLADSYVHARQGVFLQRWDVSLGRLRWPVGAGYREHDGVSGVTGSTFAIRIDGKLYYLLISEVHSNAPFPGVGEPYWTTGLFRTVESYHVMWVSAADPNITNFVDVCAQHFDPATVVHGADMLIFADDKYDPDTRVITLEGQNWINFACQGTVQAKMRLSQRVEVSSDALHKSTIEDDRSGLVHAWAAEYCGPGPSFTHTGHKIRIADTKGWFPTTAPVGFASTDKVTVEALWDADGAVCLDTPRMAMKDPTIDPDPNIEREIDTSCAEVGRARPPRCNTLSWYRSAEYFRTHWQEHGQFLTAVAP